MLGGVDNRLFDQRKFTLRQNDIKRICLFFSIGELQNYNIEKNILISHSNFFVFVKTNQGRYALKFYPLNSTKSLVAEYRLNRLLCHHHFSTPIMHTSPGKRPFMTCPDHHLVTCYSYVNGIHAWQGITKKNAYQRINSSMISLNKILSTTIKNTPIPQQENLISTINKLIKSSHELIRYDNKETIDANLLDICRTYQCHQNLFIRQKIHNNANLTNFLIDKKTVYTLDLSHIKEDYILNDLASLIISCLFFETPSITIKNIADDHFAQAQIKNKYFTVLETLIKIGLIKEYLKNIQREKSIENANYKQKILKNFIFHLSKRKKLIMTVLNKKRLLK